MSARLFGEEQWEDLLACMEERRVIPVLGPELVQVTPDHSGVNVSLEDWLAQALREELHILSDADSAQAKRPLEATVCSHLRVGGKMKELYSQVRKLLNSHQFQPPEPLLQMAGITDFNLFITTTFDSLLAAALRATRANPELEEMCFVPQRPQDLPCHASELEQPLIYHLLGKPTPVPLQFALGDEDILEWITALERREDDLPILSGEMADNQLLLLGLGYNDWLARFFLRAAKGQRLSDNRVLGELVADTQLLSEPGLVLFLDTVSSNTRLFVEEGGPVSFVRQLHERWQEHCKTRKPCEHKKQRRAAKPRSLPIAGGQTEPVRFLLPNREMVPLSIFISYSRGDLEAVKQFSAALGAAGITTWFDINRLQAGDDYERKIRNNIQACSYFVPIFSRSTAERTEAFFRREWRWAAERAHGMADSAIFVLPVMIDDVPVEDSHPPELFTRCNYASAPDGLPEDAFVARLQELLGLSPASPSIA